MVILNNITGEKNLKLKIDQERETLKKIVSVVKNYDTFVLIIKEFENFLTQNISNKNLNFENLIGSIHNYKGIFSQFHLNKLVDILHNIENKIDNNTINKSDLELTFNTLKAEIEKLESELGHNLDIILKIPKIKIIELEEKVKKSSEHDDLLTEIKKLRYKNLKDLITPYIDYTKDLAKILNKLISDPIIISKDDILVDPEIFFDFTKSLINIFRNIIDHGIESPEIRVDLGKPEKGNIKIDLFKENDKINILIEDDGQGININKLKEIAIKNNINYMSEKDLLDIIFMESITTSPKISKISGRGLGLSIVKKEVEKLGGSIKVESEYGKGTKFHIIIPEVI
jgi:chemotaxis protein histidine kinase CheA